MNGQRSRGLASTAAVLIGVLASLAAAPAVAVEDAPEPLLVFAAASLQGPLDAVAEAWTAQSGIRVAVSYAASSALARQIDQGAPAHVYLSADQAWMDWLAERERIVPATRVDLLGNALVLVAPRDVPVAARSVQAALPKGLGDTGRLAVADVDTVPAGRYAKQALQAIGRWEDVAGRLAMADNVRGALAFVARGEAPLGIVYATDAQAEPSVRIVAKFPTGTHAPIEYPVARVAGSDVRGVDCFLDFLQSGEAAEIFRASGFVAIAAGPGGAITEWRDRMAHRPRCSFKGVAPAARARAD